MLTRFVASTGTPREPVTDDPRTIEDIRCIAKLRGHELVIATELGGGVRVFAGRDKLPQRARAQLAFHEVASGRCVELDADELYIFDLQTLETLPDAPGPNDALYLYGALRGPYPERIGTPHAAIDGQLTVTRADLIAGLIDGVSHAFAYAPDAHGSRCVHALLPGERADVIESGRGVVLALPLVPGWLLDCPVPNDRVAGQILHDVLVELRKDLDITGTPLPVPNRAALEAKLVAAGWRIEGDEAVRATSRGLIFKSAERRKLPREGSLDELVAEARTLLAKMPETRETIALRRRTMRAAAPPAQPVRAPVPPPVPPSEVPRPRVAAERSDWMKDFVDAHRAPSKALPRVSTPARAVARDAKPAWMTDFADPDDDDDEAAPDKPAKPADWSKDFD